MGAGRRDVQDALARLEPTRTALAQLIRSAMRSNDLGRELDAVTLMDVLERVTAAMAILRS